MSRIECVFSDIDGQCWGGGSSVQRLGQPGGATAQGIQRHRNRVDRRSDTHQVGRCLDKNRNQSNIQYKLILLTFYLLLWSWFILITFFVHSSRDGIGKEIISRFDTDLATDKVFYTDANGREVLKREWVVKLELFYFSMIALINTSIWRVFSMTRNPSFIRYEELVQKTGNNYGQYTIAFVS